MKRHLWISMWVVGVSALLIAGTAQAESRGKATEPGGLTAFASQKQLSSTLQALIDNGPDCHALMQVTSMAARKRRPILSPARLDGAHEAVQEAAIVKRHGDYLLILHRRRLFTVAIDDRSLRPVAAVHAIGLDTGAGATDYQELLLLGSRIVLIGESADDGIEIASFRMDASGQLTREGTWHLRSAPNCLGPSHASYVIGNRLVIYSWHALDVSDEVPALLPGLRKWHEVEDGDDEDDEKPYAPTAGARDVYRKRLRSSDEGEMLHVLTQCEWASTLKCDSTVVLGRRVTEFHVDENAVYIWCRGEDDLLRADSPQGVLYRIAYDGSKPGRVPVSGTPYDQFSFRSDRTQLEVLLTGTEESDDTDAVPVALLRLPIADFSRGRVPPPSRYVALPPAMTDFTANGFVGEHVLYSSTSRDADAGGRSRIVVASVTDGRSTELDIPGRATSIHAAGSHALILGVQGEAEPDFAITRLSMSPRIEPTAQFVTPAFSQMEASTLHVLQYGASSLSSVDSIAVPVLAREALKGEYLPPPVSVAFLTNEASTYRLAGSIISHEQDVTDDTCDVVGCYEWFQNARALSIGDRILVLLGYELIEAKRVGNQVIETQRIHFAPPDIFWPARTSEPVR